MKEKLIQVLKTNQGKRYDLKALSIDLNTDSSDTYKALVKAVNELLEDYRIIEDKHHRYALIEHTDYLTGILDVKTKGFAFLAIDNTDDEDIYIPRSKLADAMHKDRVLVYVDKSSRGTRKEGTVKKIIKRNLVTLIGTVLIRGKKAYLLPDERSVRGNFIIAKNQLKDAQNLDKVLAKITRYQNDGPHEVIITDVLGNANQKGVDVLSKIFAHNIDPVFPHKVIDEASKYQTVNPNDFKNRRDLRDSLIVTIDGETAKDFDDAIEVKALDNNTFKLGVHIADVAHYVQSGSLLDKEAYRRGTSIYLVDRVIPMLPENLSNNLCSLMPNLDRLTMSCEMIIDQNGKVIKHDIYESVINSKARLTYEKINHVFETNDENIFDKPLFDMVVTMRKLARILNKNRLSTGSINFETTETKIVLDQKGQAIDVLPIIRGESETIIEEFMLIANKVIAEHMAWMQLPFIYRVHGEPVGEKLERLLNMVHALGFEVKGKNEISHKELQKLLQLVENTTSEKGINVLMLRAMNKAVYSSHNIGHFGLAFDKYTHFTSPIRRYPDLIVHRLIKTYLIQSKVDSKTLTHYENILPAQAEQTSLKERLAVTLERDILDMKKAEYMSNYIGETFEGIISSVAPFGLYVSLPNTVEGLIHISELSDDYYTFDESLLRLVGIKNNNIYTIGEKVKVKVSAVNIYEGEVDFKLMKE